MNRWRYIGEGRPQVWVAGCIPWPSVAQVPGNLAPGPPRGERNAAPASRREDPSNAMALQNRFADALRAARGTGSPAWLDGQDVPLRAAGGAGFTFREVFASLRAAGVAPHPLDPSYDGVMSAALANSGIQARGTGPTPEEQVTPDRRLGVGEGLFPRTHSWDPTRTGTIQGVAAEAVGSYAQLVSDLAAMGAGRVRHAFQQDLTWGCIFPGDEDNTHLERTGVAVLPPTEMLESMRADSFARLSPAAAMLNACLAAGVKFDPSPFNTGGGMPTNHTWNDADDSAIIPTGLKSWAELDAGRPGQQVGYLCPSPDGWDPFYWDPTSSTWNDVVVTAPPEEMLYQRYATNVWPTAAADTSPPASEYMRECARRKSLGVAAFSQGVAEWLKRIDEAWSAKDLRIYDVVDTIELGNELNAFWATSDGTGSPTDEVVEYGQREVGRYLALIAGPIRHLLADMRFRAAELSAWHPPSGAQADRVTWTDDWAFRVDWLRGILELGVPAEVAWWDDLQAAMARGGRSDEIGAWFTTVDAAGWSWPPPPGGLGAWRLRLAAGDLVHEVGFHWYHGYNADKFGVKDLSAYADAIRLVADVELLRAEVVRPLRGLDYNLALSCGEIGFSAADPGPPVDEWKGRFYSGTTPILQGAMVLRWLAMFRALDVGLASIFQVGLEHRSLDKDGSFPNFGEFSAMRLRNDVVAAEPAYNRARDMWPRPAWFAFRRFVWLLGLTRTGWVTIHHNERGFTVLGLEFPFGVSEGPDGARFDRTWRRAFLVWLDQYADDSALHPRAEDRRAVGEDAYLLLDDPAHDGYELLPVVPNVEGPTGVAPDTNGYANPRLVDWTPRKWANALVGVRAYPPWAPDGLVFGVRMCADDAQQPLCILTNGTFLRGT